MAAPNRAPIVFRPCVGYDGYKVSRDGVVRNIETGDVLAIFDRGRKPTVKIGGDNVILGRLVALTWLPSDPDDPARNCVLYRNCDKNNCCADNLRWATHAECNAHARAGRPAAAQAQKGTPIESFGGGTEPVAYVSINVAARETGVSDRTIRRALDDGLPDRTGRCWRKTEPAVLPGEEWRVVHECNGSVFAYRYEFSNQERAKGPNGLMHPAMSGDYKHLELRILDGAGNSTRRTFSFHVLVTTAFHGPPPTPQHEVNHKNKHTTDNRAVNLEWITKHENMMHAVGRPIVQKNGGGAVIARYASIRLAAEAVGRYESNIRDAIARGGKSAGFYWKYAEDDADEERAAEPAGP